MRGGAAISRHKPLEYRQIKGWQGKSVNYTLRLSLGEGSDRIALLRGEARLPWLRWRESLRAWRIAHHSSCWAQARGDVASLLVKQ